MQAAAVYFAAVICGHSDLANLAKNQRRGYHWPNVRKIPEKRRGGGFGRGQQEGLAQLRDRRQVRSGDGAFGQRGKVASHGPGGPDRLIRENRKRGMLAGRDAKYPSTSRQDWRATTRHEKENFCCTSTRFAKYTPNWSSAAIRLCRCGYILIKRASQRSEVALARGKRKYDKRRAITEREQKRDIEKRMKKFRR